MSKPEVMSGPIQLDAPAGAVAERARPRVERHLRMLDRLAEAGLDMALAIADEATSPPADGEGGSPRRAADLAQAYAKVSRAVRMTIALQSKLMQDLETLERAEARRDHDDALKVRRIVGRVIRAERGEGRHAERLEGDVRAWLERDDIYGDLKARPTSEIIASICADLGVSPDWPRLAEDAWALEEMASGRIGAPLQPFPSPLAGEGGAERRMRGRIDLGAPSG
jgi:hypothetical protein